jgi:hypothetical protein
MDKLGLELFNSQAGEALIGRVSLSEIFALSPKDSRELQVSERLGAPFFMRMDEKRWCQPSVWKGGRSFRSLFLPCLEGRKSS